MVFELGRFTYSAATGLLSKDGEPVKIPAKTLEVLRVLVEKHGSVVTREELMSQVWPDLFVEEANLSVHISNLRKLFRGDDDGDIRIDTYPKHGYRLTGATELESSSPTTPELVESVATGRRAGYSFSLNLAVVGLSFLAVIFLAASMFKPNTGSSIGTVQMIRVPSTENTISLAISPDGQTMAHVVRQGNRRGLRLRELRSGSERDLLSPELVDISSIVFNPSGKEVYFNQGNTIYSIPVNGGETRTVLENVAGRVAISADGDKFAFVRKSGQNSMLMVASSDGSDLRQVAVRNAPDSFSETDLAWSPDGTRIAVAAGTSRGDRKSLLVSVDATNGETTNLSDVKFTGFDGIVWLPDGAGVVFAAYERTSAKTHIWFLPLPDAAPRRITIDDNNYGGLSATADGRTILAGQFRPDSSIWMDRKDEEPAIPVTLEKHHEFQFISWSQADTILFPSNSTPDRDIWEINADGGNPRQLTSNSRNNLMPVGSPDGRYIVFASNRAPSGAYNIWRMKSDGSDTKQITFGDGEIQPIVSADSRWIFYTLGSTDTLPIERRIWRVPVDGGEPEQVVDVPSHWPDISPDGKFLAFLVKQGDRVPWKVAVMSLVYGSMKVFDLVANNPIRWTPDGQSISFVKMEEGQDVSNVWTIPVNGGEPKKITKFVTHFVINHDWAPDGRLFCSRSMTIRDAFLITDFR